MEGFALLAEIFRYPYPGQEEKIRELWTRTASSRLRKAVETFLVRGKSRTPEEKEMLYTHMFDLNPLVAPYIGWHIWGEDFKRGAFMAMLKQELGQTGIDLEGELPDHLVPVFRYLAVAGSPPAELLEVLVPALTKMRQQLREQDADNDYLPVLEAAVQEAERYVRSIPAKKSEEIP